MLVSSCKYIQILDKLISWTDTFSYTCSTLIIFFTDPLCPDQNIIVSSTYNRWFIFPFHLKKSKPIRLLSWVRLFQLLARTSITIMNKAGNKGSPCFKSLVEVKNNKSYRWPIQNINYLRSTTISYLSFSLRSQIFALLC